MDDSPAKRRKAGIAYPERKLQGDLNTVYTDVAMHENNGNAVATIIHSNHDLIEIV